MSSEVRVDYENMPSQSDNIRNTALELNGRLTAVYQKVTEMHAHWYGKRYNELVTKFNELAPQLNQFLEVIVAEVPYMFEGIANNFSEVDIQQNIATARKESYKKIEEIPVIDDVGMRYIQEEVANVQTEILSDFTSAKELMDSMQKTVQQIVLECDGADEFRSQFRILTDTFKQVLDNVETQFTELMNKDREQIENAEKANTTK